MKVQATVVGFLICAATTFVEAGPIPSSTDASTSGLVAAPTKVVQEPSATSVPAAAQQRNPGARPGETSENDNTSRLVLLALVVMGSIALRRGRSA